MFISIIGAMDLFCLGTATIMIFTLLTIGQSSIMTVSAKLDCVLVTAWC